MKRGCLLKQQNWQERGDASSSRMRQVGEVAMSWLKAKGEATSKILEATSPKIFQLIPPSIISWDLRPHLEKCASLKMRNFCLLFLLVKEISNLSPFSGTCQINFPSHKIHFWQLSFIFLIAEFFNISLYCVFLGFSSNY